MDSFPGRGKHKRVEYQLFDSNEQGRSEVKAQADGKAGLRLGAQKEKQGVRLCTGARPEHKASWSLLGPCRVTVSV